MYVAFLIYCIFFVLLLILISCFRVFCFVYVTVYVCRDWLFIKERDWWILKRVTLKGRRYQHTGSSLWRLLLWREELRIPAPLTDH